MNSHWLSLLKKYHWLTNEWCRYMDNDQSFIVVWNIVRRLVRNSQNTCYIKFMSITSQDPVCTVRLVLCRTIFNFHFHNEQALCNWCKVSWGVCLKWNGTSYTIPSSFLLTYLCLLLVVLPCRCKIFMNRMKCKEWLILCTHVYSFHHVFMWLY